MFPIPEYAAEIIAIIKNAGYEAYAVGGCVRDALLGTEAADVDVTTSAPPQIIQALFPHSVLTGGRFFTVTVLYNGGKAEVTPFRSEGRYSDSRRPDSVTFASDLLEDLKRRDFTMNSVCFDGERIIDPLGGKDDIDARIIRCVGNPAQRFDEDALRIMRAFRLSAQLGFNIERETLSAALANSHKLRSISVERIRDELFKTMISPAPERIAPLLECGALSFLNLNPSPMLNKIKKLNSDLPTRMSAFINMCGRDSAGILKLTTRLKRFVRGVFEALDSLPSPTDTGVKLAMSRFSSEVFVTAAEIANKIYGKSAEYSNICRRVIENGEPYRVSDLALNGTDLIKAGVPEKEIGANLERMLNEVIKSPDMNTRDSLMKIITE